MGADLHDALLKLPILYLIGVVWWAIVRRPTRTSPQSSCPRPSMTRRTTPRARHLARPPPAHSPRPRPPLRSEKHGVSAHELDRRGPAETLAGFMSAAAIFSP